MASKQGKKEAPKQQEIKEVEMKDVKEEPPKPEDPNVTLANDLKKNIALLEKSVSTQELRLTSRVLRTLSSTRKRLNVEVLHDIISSQNFSDSEDHKQLLLGYIEKVGSNQMQVEGKHPSASAPSAMDTESTKPKSVAIPEVKVYLHLLVTIFLIDNKHYDLAIESSTNLLQRIAALNRRTLHPLSAKVFFYYSRAYELLNRLEDIRGELLAAYRTACLRHNDDAQAVLLNLLLRNYLTYNLYDQADKLVSKTTLREDTTSSNQYARYLYYQGKIRSIQLDYTEAYRCLLGAIGKAPQNGARGFRITVHKLACIVQLLMGEIPERSIFRQVGLQQALEPYFQLTQSVRIGDLAAFHEVVNKYGAVFRQDRTYTLIQRLRHNVIKTALRKINLSYSRISFADICNKLHLESEEDAEFIVAKAIRDGVINAAINHEGKFIQSKENIDIYSSQEPQVAFHRRIEFCLKTHNDAVKAMRFPPDAHKPNLESVKERREREQEIAKNLAEEEDDEF